MKKIIALCTALFLITAVSSCGNSTEESSLSAPISSSSENNTPDKQESEEKIVIDPFDKVLYGIPETNNWNNKNVYPENFLIEMNASESPLGSHMSFTYFIESADENEIVIKARANIDEVQEFLDAYNYTVEETEKTFSINVADLTTNMLSPDMISGENKTKFVNAMQNFIESELKMSEDDEYEDLFEIFGFDSNNPDFKQEQEKKKAEFEQEKAESLQNEFSIEKLYVVMPSEIEYDLDARKEKSKITSHMNEDSFEDEMIYSNTAQLKISSISLRKCIIIGTFKDTTDKYYCVSTASSSKFIFDKGNLEDELLKFFLQAHVVEDEHGFTDLEYYYDDEQSSYKGGLVDINENEYQIVEISLS